MNSFRWIALNLLLTAPVAAQPTFTPQTIFTGANGGEDVVAADIDGDGDTDVLSATPDLRWHENLGGDPPTFAARLIYSPGGKLSEVSEIAAADLDGDGDVDVLIADRQADLIRWFENDGQTPVGFTMRSFPSTFAQHLDVADIDGDGALDVVSTGQLAGAVFWHRNDGMSPPSFSTMTVAAVNETFSIEARDLDDDGDVDIVAGVAGSSEIRWYENDGMPTPGFTQRTVANVGVSRLFTGDLDGDQDIDVVSAFLNTIRWHESNGALPPTFSTQVIATAPSNIESLFGADLDADGDLDFLTASSADDAIRWFENDGASPPTFTSRDIFLSADGASDVFAEDVDGDGDTDVLSASDIDHTIRWYSSDLASFVVMNLTSGDGFATIAEALAAAQSGDQIQATPERFAAEPMIDLGVGPGAKELRLISTGDIAQPLDGAYLLENDTLESAPAPQMSSVSLMGFVSLGNGSALRASTSIDAALTSELDIPPGANAMIIAPDGATVLGFFNIGAGAIVDLPTGPLTLQFATPTTSFDAFQTSNLDTSVTSVSDVVAGDFDSDGDIDGLASSQATGDVRMYVNDGQTPAGFTMQTVSTSGHAFFDPADLDNDGDIDAAYAGTNGLGWLENDGNPSPAFTANVVDFGAYGGVAATDVNGDGFTDLVGGDNFEFYWFEHDGLMPPSFTLRFIASHPNISSIEGADLDGDGDTDLIANRFGVSWYENDGQNPPSFTPVSIASGFGCESVFVIDMDGDADLDVVAAASGANQVRWYENDGAAEPTFTEHTIATGLGFPYSVFAGDIDGDSDIDVFSASANSDRIRWHESNGQTPPVFTTRTITTGADNARSVVGADLDGDGFLDAFSASFNDGTVRVHDNVFRSTSVGSGALIASTDQITNGRALTLNSAFLSAEVGLLNGGRITSSFGAIVADTTNEPIAELIVEGGTQIAGDFTNDGTVILRGSLIVSGVISNNSVIESAGSAEGLSNGALTANSDLTLGGAATLRLRATGAGAIVRGDYDAAINSNGRYDMATAALRLDGAGMQSLEVMSVDIGPSADGLDRTMPGHYPLGTLRIGPAATTVNLVDVHDNDNQGQADCEAIYTSELIVESNATLNTSGCVIYYESLTLNGFVDDMSNLIEIGACAGDLTGDGQVNGVDLAQLLAVWNTSDSAADLNGDGVVNGADLASLLANWGVCP